MFTYVNSALFNLLQDIKQTLSRQKKNAQKSISVYSLWNRYTSFKSTLVESTEKFQT